MENKINVTVAEGLQEIVVRQGEALKLKEPEAIRISGTIDAPSKFLLAKKESLKPIDSTLLVDINAGKITFTTDEKSFYRSIVTGTLTRSKALKELGINDPGVMYGDKQLAKFIKSHIFYFNDAGKANDLIKKLMKFSANIQTDLKNESDLKGNVSKAFDRAVKTDLPDTIDIKCKIYEGLPEEIFTVDICVEADASALIFYFDSPALYILEDKLKTEYLEKESLIFEGWGCAVINI